MAKKKKEYVIIGYHPDDVYELPQKVYSSLLEMSLDLNVTLNRAKNILDRGGVYKRTQLKYMKVKC